MANEPDITIPIKTTADTKAIGALQGSIVALKAELKQAKQEMDAAPLGSDQWQAAARRYVEVREKIEAGLRPLREMIEAQSQSDAAQRRLTDAVSASVNPWTTASKGWETSAAALQRVKEKADAAKAALDAQAASTRRGDMMQDAIANAQRQMAQDMRDSEAATARLRAKLDDLPDANDKAGRSAGAAGRSILEFSRMVEDAQYGIAGILNNIPTLIASLGLGAGLAGAFSLAAVGGTLLFKLLKNADFKGTWIGDVKEEIGKLVTNMSQAEAEARKIAESPLSWAKTAEEEFEEKSAKAEKALRRELDLMKEKLELQKQINTLRAEEAAHLERMHKIQNPNTFTKGTPEWAAEEAKTKWKERNTREETRVKEIRNAEAEKKTADQTAAEAARLAQQKAARVIELQNSELKRNLAKAAEGDALKLAEQAKAAEGIPGLIAPSFDLPNIVKRQKEKEAEAKRLLEESKKGMPQAGETVDKAKAAAEQASQDAIAAKVNAAEKARELEAAKVRSRQARAESEAQYKRDIDDINSAQFDKAAADQEAARKKEIASRNGGDRTVMTMPEFTPPAPPDSNPKAEIDAANKGLRDTAGQWTDPAAKGAMGALSSALNDGRGDREREAAIVNEMLSKLGTDRQKNAEALEKALREMEAVQAEGSQMQQKLAQTMASMANLFRRMNGDIEAIKSRMDDQDAARRR